MSEVTRVEFEKLSSKTERQEEKINDLSCDIREIKTDQKHSIQQQDRIEAKLDGIKGEVGMNKVQLAKIAVAVAPFSAGLAYIVSRWLAK